MTSLRVGAVTPRYFLSRALSLLGNSIAGVALPLVLLATTGDVLAAGALALICMIPQVVAGVVGGALLDRLNRRSVSVASDMVSALSVAALPLVDATVGLSFGWFVLFGLLGAIGDMPGMTARDALLPTVVRKDGADLQKFVGVSQSVDSLIVVVGPAAAAGAIGLVGVVDALWITAATSCAAALVTLTLPRSVGEVETEGAFADDGGQSDCAEADRSRASFAKATVASTKAGLKVLFAGDQKLRASIVMTLIVVMAMGGYQGLVLPVYFTEQGDQGVLGLVLSVLSAGSLAGAVVYARFTERLARRTWYVLSLVGMTAGVLAMGSLAGAGVIMAGAAMLGFFSGPFSALLGFCVYDAVPDELRGTVLGTQNALLVLAAPLAMSLSSVLVLGFGMAVASVVLVGFWAIFVLCAFAARAFRGI